MTRQKLILPFYHLVADESPIHVRNLYEAKSVKEFKDDLDFLLANYKAISLKELIEYTKGSKKITENVFHLTFDDGLKELYTVIAPILKEKNVPATFFICTDFIDNKSLFYRFKASILTEKYSAKGVLSVPYQEAKKIEELGNVLGADFESFLEKEQPYLTDNQIKELIAQGFTIGAHSQDHPLYNSISIEDQVAQTVKSVEELTNRFNLDYKVFSFPFTDDGVSEEFFSRIKNKVDLTFGTAGLKKDSISFNLQRIPMEQPYSGKEIIKGEYFYYLLKKTVGKSKIKRK